MKKRWVVIGVIALIMIISLSMIIKEGKEKIEGECEKDADCVKDSCCHASGCVSADNAPKCDGIFCTQVCEPGTLDCGGICKCIDGKCSGLIANGSDLGIANPASAYCIEQGGKLEIRSDNEGNQYGICVLTNGTECDEWNYYRGAC